MPALITVALQPIDERVQGEEMSKIIWSNKALGYKEYARPN